MTRAKGRRARHITGAQSPDPRIPELTKKEERRAAKAARRAEEERERKEGNK